MTDRCAIAAVTFFALVTSAFAECPPVGFFPDGIGGTADQYASSGDFSVNAEGVLVNDYGDRYNGLGKWPNPFFISRYANGLYADWHRGGCTDDGLREAFLTQAEWFAANVEISDGMALWTYPFENPHYDLEGGWISGIGQSHIAAVLHRAYVLTGDDHYLELSRQAMEPYFRPMAEGGVVSKGDGGTWVQEAPHPDGISFNVLNGHITGILGVLDMAVMTGEQRYQTLVEEGINAVRAQIHNFDAGFTSFYALRAPHGDPVRLAPLDGYHNLHIRQLERLYEIDGDPAFLEMAQRWRGYQLAEYRRSALGSSVETHTAEDADGRGKEYWSHNKFPTWYQIDLVDDAVVRGVYIGSQSPLNVPRELDVLVLQDGQWTPVWSSDENEDMNLLLTFPAPVAIDAFRLDIASDNGRGNVALKWVAPILAGEGEQDAATEIAEAHQVDLQPGYLLAPCDPNNAFFGESGMSDGTAPGLC